jgi:hypothetical protein
MSIPAKKLFAPTLLLCRHTKNNGIVIRKHFALVLHDRLIGFGTKAYAAEELVAEMTAALLCAYAIIQYLKLKRKVKASARHNTNIALDLSLRGHSARVPREEQIIHLLTFNAARYRYEAGSLRGATMATKSRPWTATEIYRLKGLAKEKIAVSKIARSLKRTAAATAVKARALGIPLDANAI